MWNEPKLPKSPEPGSLDDLLDRIVDAVQLTGEQHNRAENLYHEIGRWLGEPGGVLAQYKPDIFPQGSMLLRTTVRPMSVKGEDISFDLDLVGRARIDPTKTHAGVLYNMFKDRLEQKAEYKRRLDPRPRCLRLDYPEELFYLDVIPACPDPADPLGVAILIPDKGEWTQHQAPRSSYKETDPLRYADWFEQNTEVRIRLMEKSASASIAPVPPREPANLKVPLRKTAQIIKRSRDLDFLGDDQIPSSILITTMAARAYRGEADLALALDSVLKAMNKSIRDARPGRVTVLNPTNKDEDFAAVLKPATYEKFARFIDRMSKWISAARQTPVGRKNVQPVLEQALGKSAVAKAYDSLEKATFESSRTGNLGTKVGGGLTILTAPRAASGVQPVSPNNFHLKA